jgi:hypothetical protein
MRHAAVVIAILAVLLVISNGYWLYLTIDNAITMTYRADQCALEHRALEQTLAILPMAARSKHDRAQIIDAARGSYDPQMIFEKGGIVWVDAVGLHFDQIGHLVGVRPSWSFP